MKKRYFHKRFHWRKIAFDFIKKRFETNKWTLICRRWPWTLQVRLHFSMHCISVRISSYLSNRSKHFQRNWIKLTFYMYQLWGTHRKRYKPGFMIWWFCNRLMLDGSLFSCKDKFRLNGECISPSPCCCCARFLFVILWKPKLESLLHT